MLLSMDDVFINCLTENADEARYTLLLHSRHLTFLSTAYLGFVAHLSQNF